MIDTKHVSLACRDEEHKIDVSWDEDNLDWEPEIKLLNHDKKDILAESVKHEAGSEDICKCIQFVVNWRGAATVKLFSNVEGEKPLRVTYKVET